MITMWIGHATRKAETPISLPHIVLVKANVVISMKNFIEVPASIMSLAKRKPVYGVGINDADYRTKSGNDRCPFYIKWIHMLERCYSQKYKDRHPTYHGCEVCEEWLIFSNFKSWMMTKEWFGKEIDKDILIPGNKIYSPVTCIFVSRQVNGLLSDHGLAKGDLPQGVTFNKDINKFQAMCKINGKHRYLGIYDTPEEASHVYNMSKAKEIRRIASLQTDIRVKEGLLKHAELRLNA